MSNHFNSKHSKSKDLENQENSQNQQQGKEFQTSTAKTILHKATLVVVADSCHARIYRLVKFPKIEEIFHFEHPESRLRNQDLVSAKPGRSFQRSGSVQYSYQPETEPKQLEALKFARQLADFLSSAEKKGEFNRLYVIAEPSFLGLLRQHISHEVQKTIVAEVAKELTSCDVAAIESHLSEI